MGYTLIKYFLAALTIPEEDLWVNLSPYEKNRIIPDNLNPTDLGKDLLGQDYTLKQLVSSLTYPDSRLGKKYWKKIFEEVYQLASTTNIPINTFNKVWIVPDTAEVYENGNVALITEAKLKVLSEEDYLAMNKQENISVGDGHARSVNKNINKISQDSLKEIILPEIEWDVNHGENFAKLRQMYNSLILATWFKKKLKNSIYQYYIDQGKTKGIDLADPAVKDKIYNLYVKSFKKGVYDYIKTDKEPFSRKRIKRQYHSGGISSSGLMDKLNAKKIASSSMIGEVDKPFIIASGNVRFSDQSGETISSMERSSSAIEAYKERQEATKSNLQIKAVFEHNKNNLEKYPFLHHQERSLQETIEFLNLDIVKLIISEYKKKLKDQTDKQYNILDVGCGKGVLLRDLKDFLKKGDFTFTGISPDSNLSKETEGISYQQSFAEILPDDWTNKFDFIIAVQSLYLMADPIRAVEEMFRVMTPGGITIVDIGAFDVYFDEKANDENWFYNVGLLKYVRDKGYRIESDGKSFALIKSENDSPLIFPLKYKKPFYTTLSPEQMGRLKERVGEEVDLGKTITLYNGAIYEEKTSSALTHEISDRKLTQGGIDLDPTGLNINSTSSAIGVKFSPEAIRQIQNSPGATFKILELRPGVKLEDIVDIPEDKELSLLP